MAGSGKGVLRIAIEDFLQTSPMGKWFGKIYEDLGDWFEDALLADHKEIFEQVSAATKMSILEQIAAGKKPGERKIAWLPIIAGALVGIGVGVFQGFAAPYGQLATYYSSRLAKQYRYGIPQAILGLFRFPGLDKTFREDLYDQGLDDAHIDKLKDLAVNLLSPGDYVSAWLRKAIPDNVLDETLLKLQYTPADIKIIKELSQVIPGVSDLVHMAVKEAFTPDVVKRFGYDVDIPIEAREWAKKIGLSEEWFNRFWYAHWETISPGQAAEMLHRLRPGRTSNPFTADDMRTVLKVADYPAFFRDRFIEISYNPYTRVDIRRMYKLGILNEDEVYQAYLDDGYDEVHAKNLATFTIKYETGSDSDKIDEYRSLTVGQIKDAMLKNIIDRSHAAESLKELKYSDDEIETILKTWEFGKVVDTKDPIESKYAGYMLTSTIKAYASRMMSSDEAHSTLQDLNYNDDEINIMLQYADFEYQMSILSDVLKTIGDAYTSRAIDMQTVVGLLGRYNITGAQQTALLDEWELTRNLRSRRLTEAQYRTALQRGIINQDGYQDAMKGLGYTDTDISILVALQAAPEEA